MSVSSISATSENDTQFISDNSQLNDVNTENSYQTSGSTHIFNSSSFKEYVTEGKFNEKVSEGDIIDIRGKLDDPKFALEVNKPVNIISSTGDAYIDLDTHSTDTSGGYTNGIFQISTNGAGTNMTGITFHNTRIYIRNTANVCVDNITEIVESNVGFGVGSFSIREKSENITVKNSYFMNYFNGGHSNVVIAGASNCLIENNTIQCDNNNGLTGNLLYLTTYGGSNNKNITIRNNTLRTIGRTYETNYGLCLEGSGHIIEGNIIDNGYPVMAQYADVDYGTETNIDKIIFNNNTILKGQPQIVFPAIVANNTFMDGALLKQVYAYNNTFNTVTIQNNVKFENNVATKITVTGNNNTLEHNEIRSDEEYAINIAGENNTLKNNLIISNSSYGENAIKNTTSYVSLNNSEKTSRIFYITKDNILDYFGESIDSGTLTYTMKDNIFNDGDILVFNYTTIESYIVKDTSNNAVNLIIENSTASLTPYFTKSLTVKNSFLPTMVMPNGGYCKITLINSTLGGQYGFNMGSSLILDENSKLISDYKYFLHDYPDFDPNVLVLDNNGYILNDVNGKILVCRFTDEYKGIYDSWGISDYSLYCENIYINKLLNFESFSDLGIIQSTVHLISGSESTTFNGITFENDVIVESDFIIFDHCTFNKNVILKGSGSYFKGNIFNGVISLDSTKNIIFNDNIINSSEDINVINTNNLLFENNTVMTTSDNTIIFDEQSYGNTVKNNVLKAGSLIGDDSVIAGDNDVFDNSPSYNTSILIENDDLLFPNDVSTVNITVNNINTESPVDKGYVEVYLDGVLQGIKTLTDGKVSVEVNTNQSSMGAVPLKVWYYDGIRYSNNVTTKTVNVVKSDVTISVDEFTAKLNEKSNTKITFLNQKDNPVQNTNVTVTVGRTTYTVETADGVATLDELVTKEWLDAARMTVTFPDTELYNRNSTTITLNTSKADVIITPAVTVEDNTASISLTLTDDLKQNVTDGKVTITTLDGTTLGEARVRNGLVETTVTLPDDYSDEYLVANFTGSYYYNDMVRNIKITTVLNSTITLETNSPLVGEELIINGKLTDSKNNPISKENITLDLNGTKVQLTTDEDGNYNYSYVPALGTSTITVTFNGNPDTYGTSTSKDVTIRDTDREMNEVLNRLDDLQKENEKLQEQLEQLQEQLEQLREQNNKTAEELNNITQQNNELKEQLDNQTSNLTAQNEALQEQLNNITQQNNATQEQLAALEEQNKELNDKLNNMTKDNEDLKEQLDNQTGNLTAQNEALQDQLDSINEQNEKLNDKLNDLLDLINQLNAPKDTVLTLDALDDAKYGDSITIAGSLVDVGGNGVAGTVKLTINGGRATVVSDASGTFTYDYVVTRMGLNNIMATYMGTDKYNPSNTSATVNVVEQDTNIVLDNMDAIRSGDNVVVSGQLVDANGKGVYGTVKLTINNGRATVKTDADGFFKYEKALSKVGVNNITAAYVASAKYNACDVTGTVDVTALGTNIVLDDIASVRSGENITISGKLLDENNKAIVGTIKLLINNGRATVKTNNNGEFTYTTSLTKVGSNNITVSYLGANRYSACNITVSVDVSVMDTVLVIDDVADAKKGDIVSVSGRLVDANGNAVVGTVKLTINGGRATVKTGNDGVFVYDYAVTKAGLTNVTASYLGANRYGASSATSTVDVAKLATKITFNPLDSVVQKTSMNITGQLSDENDNGIYGTVKLLINNGRATVKTDKAGLFTYTFTPSKVGENTVTANYLESNNYEASESTIKFTVVKA